MIIFWLYITSSLTFKWKIIFHVNVFNFISVIKLHFSRKCGEIKSYFLHNNRFILKQTFVYNFVEFYVQRSLQYIVNILTNTLTNVFLYYYRWHFKISNFEISPSKLIVRNNSIIKNNGQVRVLFTYRGFRIIPGAS